MLPVVRETARLRAQTAIAAAPSDHRRQSALSGIAHTQRAVDKDLGLNPRVFRDVDNIPHRKLPREHHAGKSLFGGKPRTLQGVHGQLCRCMEHGGREMLPNRTGGAQILNDQRIRARLQHPAHILQHGRKLAVTDQCVDGHVGLDPVFPAVGECIPHLLLCEIFCAAAGVERAEAEIDGVRSIADRRAHGLRRARRSEQFRVFLHCFLNLFLSVIVSACATDGSGRR